MKVTTAQLPALADEDRVLVTDHSVIVLDGATAHDPAMPAAREYVDTLGAELRSRIDRPGDLRGILAGAIAATADHLQLRSGVAPSSTVALLRICDNIAEILTLGDSPVIVGRTDNGFDIVTDTRLDDLNLPESTQYRNRLASGTGYDETHRGILRVLRRKQRERRNQAGGYWIAETEPDAAYHAVTARYPAESVPWIVLATDGAASHLAPLEISWPDIAKMNATGLRQFLERGRHWEADHDPDGQLQPRSKRHDDMTIAVALP
ncbi:PP2C family serine/threonine-protein phosphatase [Nocardia sp. NPDC051981]|uniref:PP2C family serine/threonine-protein phosphatase n=1 Tax=Nocardia sp. NPDC051981 TaxID=3155417 RepID=UPI0034215683